MAGMAGKGYAAQNTDRLKAIPLGSGNVYMIPYTEGSSMPSDATFEQNANMIGRTKNGATFNYSQSFYTAVSDDGVAKKRRLNEETASFSWGIMTCIVPVALMALEMSIRLISAAGSSPANAAQ